MSYVVCRDEFQAILAGKKFAFTLLAHMDEAAAQLEFSASTSVLQVVFDHC